MTQLIAPRSIFKSILLNANQWEKDLDFNSDESKALSSDFLQKAPLLSLWGALQNARPEALAPILPRLSSEQRVALVDLSQWSKDRLSEEHFSYWPQVYSACDDDEVVEEFLSSDAFLLLLKGKFNIYTFDVEDPQYPEGDNYFLTEDGLLLFEYEEGFEAVEEVKILLRRLTSFWGVERTYTHLFKMVSENFGVFEEYCYQEKKQRLSEYGLVDYYDALKIEAVFHNEKQLSHYLLLAMKKMTPEVSKEKGTDLVPSVLMTPFIKSENILERELLLVEAQRRLDYLQFNLVQLFNARMVFEQVGPQQKIELLGMSKEVLGLMLIGLGYARNFYAGKVVLEQGLLSIVDFQDLYKMGKSLIAMEQAKIKKTLENSPFNTTVTESFLGAEINSFLDSLLSSPPRLKEYFRPEENEFIGYEDLIKIQTQAEFLTSFLPFAGKLHQEFKDIGENSSLLKSGIRNYSFEEVDLEVILSSALCRFILEKSGEEIAPELPLLTLDAKSFLKLGRKYFSGKNVEGVSDMISDFTQLYGLGEISQMVYFLKGILERDLIGNDWENLSENDMGHIAGALVI